MRKYVYVCGYIPADDQCVGLCRDVRCVFDGTVGHAPGGDKEDRKTESE